MYRNFDLSCRLRNLTPGPSPFSSTKITPADSRAARTRSRLSTEGLGLPDFENPDGFGAHTDVTGKIGLRPSEQWSRRLDLF